MTSWLAELSATAISVAFLILLFLPMERTFPAKRGQKFFRKAWLLDLCFLLGQYLIWNFLIVWTLNYIAMFSAGLMSESFMELIRLQPFWLQVTEVVFLSDFLIYWAHRLQHHSAFLWRFHKVHHSAENLDWLAAHREHPLDTVYTVGIINLPAILLGFPIESIAGFIAFRGIWAIYIHSNVRLPIGPLKMMIGSPEIHHWHHDKNIRAGNYANISPLMDIAFGTYTCPDQEPESFGIEEQSPKTYLGHMVEPLMPSKTKNRSQTPISLE